MKGKQTKYNAAAAVLQIKKKKILSSSVSGISSNKILLLRARLFSSLLLFQTMFLVMNIHFSQIYLDLCIAFTNWALLSHLPNGL